MAHIEYVYSARCTFKNRKGDISVPGLSSERGGLYVIHNMANMGRPYYIGTAINYKERFKARTEAARELGFPRGLDDLEVFVVRVECNGRSVRPDKWGKLGLCQRGGLDAEHLLIRMYIQALGCNVRNISKTRAFTNRLNENLDIDISCRCGAIEPRHLPPSNCRLGPKQSF